MAQLLEKAKEFVAEKIADIPKPEATVTDVDLKGVSLSSVEFLAKVSVKNPYPQPLPICDVSYVLKSARREIASGKVPDPGNLKASGETMLDVSVLVPYSILVSLARDVAGDWDIDYELLLDFVIDLPVVGNITIPVSQKGEIKLPTLKDIF